MSQRSNGASSGTATVLSGDLVLRKTLQRGASGGQVKLVQEWVSLHGTHVKVDGDFGPATEAAVSRFQEANGLTASGVVDQSTFARLIEPMTRAMDVSNSTGTAIGHLVVAYARQHLREHPREVGGSNRGPWVRLYMNGRQGANAPWCAGFVCYLLRQACDHLVVELPLKPSFSCDVLAANAMKKGLFLSESDARSPGLVTPGSVFLVRKKSGDWTHTGIVISATPESVETIEGNTNEGGSREGFEVRLRIRHYRSLDFIVI